MATKLSAQWKNRLLALLGAALTCTGVVLLCLLGDSGETITTFSMGSYVQQTIYGSNKTENARLAANAVAELEDLLSWRKEGDIAMLNAAAGEEFCSIDSRTEAVLNTAIAVAQASDGAFDPTIAPISRLWDFDDNPHVPDTAMVERFLSKVDYTALSVLGDGTAALRLYDTALDLGAIGKGAACDAAAQAYRDTGVTRAIVAVGGSIGLYGDKPLHQLWRVAVRNPNTDGSLGTLSLSGGNFLSTSGDYEKTFTEDGVTYHHLLDPKTGYPAQSELRSVTVVSSGGALSDALSTACFVLGLEKATALLEEFDAQAVFVTEENKVYLTAGLQEAFTLSAEGYSLEVLS